MVSDFWIVLRWWGSLFLVGAVAFPLTKRLFHDWYDHGYLFSKAVGMATVTFLVYVVGSLHLFPFTFNTVAGSLVVVFLAGLAIQARNSSTKRVGRTNPTTTLRAGVTFWRQLFAPAVLIILAEEVFFFVALLFWSWIKGHEASIHGLEKFMDFGFTQSILNSKFFPAPDMWYTGLSINYYYFGHTVLAVLTRISGIDLMYTFNLMLASIFAFTLTMSFSIGTQLFQMSQHAKEEYRVLRIAYGGKKYSIHNTAYTIFSGIVTALLVTLAGNMQTIYAFTKGYTGDNVQPFWNLLWTPSEFFSSISMGLERYWYANATRFIPFTIHEFPSYSFVVSDVHGHVLSLPFVLLAIALLIMMFGGVEVREPLAKRVGRTNPTTTLRAGTTFLQGSLSIVPYIFFGFLCGVLLMTNALDGPIYLGLFLVLFMIHNSLFIIQLRKQWKQMVLGIGSVIVSAILTSLPFLLYFKSFVSGLAINCPPEWFADRKIGPFLFETVEKCQHSPLWMMWLLWGFFWFCGASFVMWRLRAYGIRIRKLWNLREVVKIWLEKFTGIEKILTVFFIVSIALIIFPEFFYFKDIYPAHFRSNTMFKLGYQAFIMWSIVSGYMIVQALYAKSRSIRRTIFFILLAPQLFLVIIYPIFSVRSYFNSLKHYEGLYGLTWLLKQYPDDWAGIGWLRQHAKGENPVIVEADGDSYTDYARYSAFTGLPTIIGWPVHEWLWRGTYDVVAPRREDVRKIYESTDLVETKAILVQYKVSYIIVGTFEREKYKNIAEWKFATLGKVVFEHGLVRIYQLNH